MSQISQLRKWLLLRDDPASVVHFKTLVQQFAKESLGKDELDALAYAEGAHARLWRGILQESDRLKRLGLLPSVEIVDIDQRLIKCAPPLNGIKNNSAFEIRLGYRNAVYKWLDELDWREYEFVGAFCLHLAGGTDVVITPPGNEAGIDFLGIVDYFGKSRALHSTYRRFKVIGQSKKFSSAVVADKLKIVDFTVRDIARMNPFSTANLPPAFFSTRGPLFPWVNAHSGFQSGARRIGQAHGMMLSDSLELAEAICTSKAIPMAHSSKEFVDGIVSSFEQFVSSVYIIDGENKDDHF